MTLAFSLPRAPRTQNANVCSRTGERQNSSACLDEKSSVSSIESGLINRLTCAHGAAFDVSLGAVIATVSRPRGLLQVVVLHAQDAIPTSFTSDARRPRHLSGPAFSQLTMHCPARLLLLCWSCSRCAVRLRPARIYAIVQFNSRTSLYTLQHYCWAIFVNACESARVEADKRMRDCFKGKLMTMSAVFFNGAGDGVHWDGLVRLSRYLNLYSREPI